jgi:hypothetical protein
LQHFSEDLARAATFMLGNRGLLAKISVLCEGKSGGASKGHAEGNSNGELDVGGVVGLIHSCEYKVMLLMFTSRPLRRY